MKTLRLYFLCALSTALLSGCAATVGTSPKGAELAIEKAAIQLAADVKSGGYGLVNAGELNTLLAEKKKLILIDSMPAEAFAKSRIPGAVNAPMPKSEKELTPAEKELLLQTVGADKDTPVVTYCGFVACRRSHIAAKILTDNGYRAVSRFPGGIVAWEEAGYPLEP